MSDSTLMVVIAGDLYWTCPIFYFLGYISFFYDAETFPHDIPGNFPLLRSAGNPRNFYEVVASLDNVDIFQR